jgi:hypothetical protein
LKDVTREQAHDLCLRLLRAETEEGVVEILREKGFWNDRSVWKPYGDIPNNRGIVGNQQSEPVASLVEKVVNSIDAVLTAECYRAGVDPTGADAPKTMHEAVQRFLKVPDGRIQNLDATGRTRLAARIQLVATGTKDRPNYLIIDDGEGQSPDQFADTFLSLLRENKTGIPFVQGKYNMGGTGVFQFAGTHSFQLIISRRQPDLPSSGSRIAGHWGFTLVRRLEPTLDRLQSTYVYLAPGGQILSFEADSLPVRPGRYPNAYEEPLSAGTCIKIWNYKVPGRLKSLATLDLRYALERHLQDPALPVRIYERRPGYKAHSYDTTMSGLFAVLADNRTDIEPGLDTGTPLDVPGVGRVELRMVVIREGVDDKRYPSGIFFNVNGQLHSELGSDFVSRRTKLDYVANGLIVVIDCTNLPPRIREDLFLASRDRMRHIEERVALETEIVEYLRDHPGLREINARRRQARLTRASEEESARVIQSLVRSDPTLSSLFGRGREIRVPVGPVPESVPYVGREYPTYFRIANEPRGGLVKRCPRNRTFRVEFETDAANDYFSRSRDPGQFDSRGVPILKSLHLWNGRVWSRYGLPEACNIGDTLRVEVSVMDVSRVYPLQCSFSVVVEPDAPPGPPGPPTPPPGVTLAGIPPLQEVWREQWAGHGFNEHTALVLKHGEDDVLDAYVNMDNIHLRNEIARRRDMDPYLLRYWFKYGLYLLALGMLYEQRQHRGTSEDEDDAQRGLDDLDTIAVACRGLAVTIIPIMAHIGRAAPEALPGDPRDRPG